MRASTKPPVKKRTRRRPRRLPEMLRQFFWEYRFRDLSWKADRDLVTWRILTHGDWKATCWLRRRLGDDELRQWILARDGRGLSSRQLRFWELILGLPPTLVNRWVKRARNSIWERR